MHPGPLAYSLGLEKTIIAARGSQFQGSRFGSALEGLFHELVGQLRVCLAATALHDLADEEAERLRLTGAVLDDGIGISREHVADDDHHGSFVADLRQAF